MFVTRLAEYGICLLAFIVACVSTCSDTTYTQQVTIRKSRASKYDSTCGFWWAEKRCTKYRTSYYTGYTTRTYTCPSTTGSWGSWSSYSTCTHSCEGGTKKRTRSCRYSRISQCCAKCSGLKTQTQTVSCNTHCCPINGGWTDWNTGHWDSCPDTCGEEILQRTDTRTCTNPAPACGGNNCFGDSSRTLQEKCLDHGCPVHGGWSSWNIGEWDNCPTTCGNEILYRTDTRTCSDPAPLNGGNNCVGSLTRTLNKTCLQHDCPVHGGWSSWNIGEWDNCPTTCGEEILYRTDTRACNNPTPLNGGNNCVGSTTRTLDQKCLQHGCPVHGNWTEWNGWGTWDECTTTCDKGVKFRNRERTCTNPAPQNSGNDCVGDSTEVDQTSCILFTCPTTICSTGAGHYKHPNPQKCNMFLNCGQNNETHEMTCGTNTAWNEVTVTCDQDAAVDCLGTCNNGYYEPHPTNCSMYYHCAAGTKIAKTCSDGKRWNGDITNCDHAENVECTTESEDESAEDENETKEPQCACNVTDAATVRMCKCYNYQNCNYCTHGNYYAHDENNCKYYYLCSNTCLIRMFNPPLQYYDKTDGVFKVKASGCQK